MLEHGCIRVGFLEKQNRQDAYINRERERERGILRNWLM